MPTQTQQAERKPSATVLEPTTQSSSAEGRRVPAIDAMQRAADHSPGVRRTRQLQTLQRPRPHPVTVVQRTRDTALIGTELSFTNKALYGDWQRSGGQIVTNEVKKTLARWKDTMSNSGAKISEEGSKKGLTVRFTFDNGWWYQVAADAGSVETQVKPFTEEQLNGEVGGLIDKFIFGTAASLGLKADRLVGGGHINLDVGTTFDGDAELFRNFLVLYDQLFGSFKQLDADDHAKSFSELKGGARARSGEVLVKGFTAGKTTIPELAAAIREKVHTPDSLPPDFLDRLTESALREAVPNIFSMASTIDDAKGLLDEDEEEAFEELLTYKIQHNQATNVQHIEGKGDDRLELRRFSAQPDLQTLQMEADLVLSLLQQSKGNLTDLQQKDWTELVARVKPIAERLSKLQSDVISEK